MAVDPGVKADIDLNLNYNLNIPPPDAQAFSDHFSRALSAAISLKDANRDPDFRNMANTTRYLSDMVVLLMIRDDVTNSQRAQFNAAIEGVIEFIFSQDSTLQHHMVITSSGDIANVLRVLLSLAALRTFASGRSPLNAEEVYSTTALSASRQSSIDRSLKWLNYAIVRIIGGGSAGAISGVFGGPIGITAGAVAGAVAGLALAAESSHSTSAAGSAISDPRPAVSVGASRRGLRAIGASSWNMLSAGQSAVEKWTEHCPLLFTGDTANGISPADVVLLQEVDMPASGGGFQKIRTDVINDQYCSRNPNNRDSGWDVYVGSWTIGATRYQTFELNTERQRRNLVIALHPELKMQKIKIVAHPAHERTPVSDERFRPILGLQVCWRAKKVGDPDDVPITFYCVHAEASASGERSSASYNEQMLPILALHTAARWAALGDFNREPPAGLRGPSESIYVATAVDKPTHLNKPPGADNRLDYMVVANGVLPSMNPTERLDYLGPVRVTVGGRIEINTTKSDHYAVHNGIASVDIPAERSSLPVASHNPDNIVVK